MRIRKLLSDETGQALVVAAMLAVAVIGIVALTVDVGFAMVQKREAQNAADAGALAVAGEIRDGASEAAAIDYAEDLLADHGFVDGDDAEVTINRPPLSGPFAGDDEYAEVTIESTTTAHFAQVLGTDFFEYAARAVAHVGQEEIPPGVPSRALFALQAGCSASDPLKISGSDADIIGGVHSNSKVDISGSNNLFIDGLNTRVCSFTDGGSGNVIDPPFTTSTTQPDPLGITWAMVPCTRTFTSDTDLSSVNNVWVGNNPSSNQLKPGVYCSTRKLTLSKSDVSGNVTLVSQQELVISGSNWNLTSYWEDLLFMTTSSSSSAMDLAGSGGSWEGFIYAPNGKVKLNGSSNLSIKGAVVSKQIELSGQNISIDSTTFQDLPPGQVGEDIALVE